MRPEGLSRLLIVVSVAGIVACGSQPSARQPAARTCSPLHVAAKPMTLAPSDQPTTGFALPTGTQPVGIIRDGDGASVWLLGTGSNTVYHVMPGGQASAYVLPFSELGIQLSQAPDGTVWAPEQYRNAVAAIGRDGAVRECLLPGKDREPVATSAAADGSVWITEARGSAIAHLVGDKFSEYPIGQAGVRGGEVLADPAGGAWFTVMGAPVLGHVSDSGEVQLTPIGGSGTYLGVIQAADGAVWVADFNGDSVIRVAPGGALTEWKAQAGSKPQGLAFDSGGVLWVTESNANWIARVHGSTLERVLGTGQWPDHVTITSDGHAWFTEYYSDRVGRVTVP